jgi:hypothetical protein
MGATTINLTPSAAPTAPAQAGHAPRVTADDVVSRLVDYLGADPGEANYRQARRALVDGYREFGTVTKWTYLLTQGRIFLKGAQTDGTVAYAAATRQLTLTGATWPSWAPYGWVRVNNVIAKVDQVVSPTVVTLRDPVDYQADVAAGTGYSLFRDCYTLPLDFVNSGNMMAETVWGEMGYVTPDQAAAWVRWRESFGQPRWYTVMGDPDLPGRLAVRIFPYPDADGTMDFVYSRRPRALGVLAYSTGTATIAAGTPGQASFAGATLTQQMVGSVLRVSSDPTNLPTGLEGLSPFAFEATITGVPTPTTCTLDCNAPQAFTNAPYLISDPIDFEDAAMGVAFSRCCEKNLTVNRSMKEQEAMRAAYQQALVLAMEADQRVSARRSASVGGAARARLAFMPRGPDIS